MAVLTKPFDRPIHPAFAVEPALAGPHLEVHAESGEGIPNPFALPGNRQKTGGNDQWPLQCEWVAKFGNGTFTTVSRLKCDTRGT